MINITDAVMIMAVVSLSIYDIYALVKGGVDATISKRMVVWSHKYPIIPFAFGVLMGHFFWQI